MRGLLNMHVIVSAAFAGLFTLSLGACANIMSIDRETPVGKSGKIVHLDAKQRAIISKWPKVGKDGKYTEFLITCAEPSPDALSAFSASVGAGISAPDQDDARMVAALSNTVGSIGLRTQSIQLMRDALYRVCEAYYGRALNQRMVMQLHERYQDITVAILAIEQLTGAVVASQMILTGNTSANASAQLLNLQRTLDEMIARERQKTQEADASDDWAERLEAQAAAADKALQDARDKQNSDEAPTEEEVKELKKAAEDSRRDATRARDGATADRKFAEEAKLTRQAVEDTRNATVAAVKETITSTGRVAPESSSRGAGGKFDHSIASAVENIVLGVLNKDHVRDSCIVFMSSKETYGIGTGNDAWDARAFKEAQATREFCRAYLEWAIKKSSNIPWDWVVAEKSKTKKQEDGPEPLKEDPMRDSCLAFLFNKSNYTIGLATGNAAWDAKAFEEVQATRDICRRYLEKIWNIGAFTKEPDSSADNGAG